VEIETIYGMNPHNSSLIVSMRERENSLVIFKQKEDIQKIIGNLRINWDDIDDIVSYIV
jgi:hypothetical protein